MKRIIEKVIVVSVIFFSSCNSQHIIVSNSMDIVEEASKKEYSSHYSKNEIDKKLIKYLLKEKKFNLQMVNPGDMYNPTDVYVAGLPDKQLIVYGKSEENLNCILYNERGNKSTNSCLLYKKKNNVYSVSFLSVQSSINDLEKLKLALKNRNYEAMH
jgi:hypothetical protein